LLFALPDLHGCLPDQRLHRAGEVRLIEVAGFVDRVKDRDPLFQESRRIPGAFDLPNRAVGDSGCAQKVPLCGSNRQAPRLTP
jgi:hypothetical protein